MWRGLTHVCKEGARRVRWRWRGQCIVPPAHWSIFVDVFNSRKKLAESHSLLVFRLHRLTEVINTRVIFHVSLKLILKRNHYYWLVDFVSALCIVVCQMDLYCTGRHPGTLRVGLCSSGVPRVALQGLLGLGLHYGNNYSRLAAMIPVKNQSQASLGFI